LAVLMAVKGFASTYNCRLAALSLLSKFLWNPVKGPEASSTLRRFIPEPLVVLLRSRAGSASLLVLDSVSETPELIWTAVMQDELRKCIVELFRSQNEAENLLAGSNKLPLLVNLPVDFAVLYQQLVDEIYIGGVYIRFFLKQPTYKLSNPVLFAEKLVEFWESSFKLQISTSTNSSLSNSTAVVLAQSDLLVLLTSCIICVVKGEPSIIDLLLTWGFVQNLSDNLRKALDAGRRGSPTISVIRLLMQIVHRPDIVDSLAQGRTDLIFYLTKSMYTTSNTANGSCSIAKDAAIIVELMKKIFLCTAAAQIGLLVHKAVESNLPHLILEHILDARSTTSCAQVLNPAALRVYSVDLLKAMLIAADPATAAVLRTLLDTHPSWREFKDQSHDLFLTDLEKTDTYLIEDSHESRFAGLITDGSLSSAVAAVRNSTSIPAVNRPLKGSATVPIPAAKVPPSTPNIVPSNIASKPTTTKFTTVVVKSELGIGLDLAKCPQTGRARIAKFKEFPGNIENPAMKCNPSICIGDIVYMVNSERSQTFADMVQLIRSAVVGESISLSIERCLLEK